MDAGGTAGQASTCILCHAKGYPPDTRRPHDLNACVHARTQVLYDRVKATVQDQMQELLQYREQDGLVGIGSRLRHTVAQLLPVWQEGVK